MKKLSFFALALATAFAASAQVSVVKDAEKAMKSKASGAEVVKMITPAFTDPATEQLAETWYIPGQALFQDYENMYKLRTANQNDPNATPEKMGAALLGSFEYFMKALPLDTIVEDKGNGKTKIKTKYSNPIYKVFGGYVDDLNLLGSDMYNAQNYAGAAKAWEMVADLLQRPRLPKTVFRVP